VPKKPMPFGNGEKIQYLPGADQGLPYLGY
jgi:hypothetical protein